MIMVNTFSWPARGRVQGDVFSAKAEYLAEIFHRRRRQFPALGAVDGGEKAFGVPRGPEDVGCLHKAGQFVCGNQCYVLGVAPPDNHRLSGIGDLVAK